MAEKWVFFFLRMGKEWGRRLGKENWLAASRCFQDRSILEKNTHLKIANLELVSSKTILSVPIEALGGLQVIIAQFEYHCCMEKKNDSDIRIPHFAQNWLHSPRDSVSSCLKEL